jgi:hypothetical protein
MLGGLFIINLAATVYTVLANRCQMSRQGALLLFEQAMRNYNGFSACSTLFFFLFFLQDLPDGC